MNKVKEIIKKIKGFFGKVFHKGKPGIFSKFKVGKTGIILVVLAIILGGLYYFKGLFIVAVVNGQPIYRLSVIQTLEKSNGKSTLDSMVTEALIYQEAKKLNVLPTDAEIKTEVDKLTAQLKASGQDINALLAFQNMTLKDLETQIRLQKTVEKILADKVTVTQAEIDQYIVDNKASIPTTMSQAEVTATAEQQIKSQKLGTAFQSWIQSVKTTSNINYLVKY
jgi:hypothetical protein